MDDLSNRAVEPVPVEATGVDEIVVPIPDISPQVPPVTPAAPAGAAFLGNVFEAAKLVEPEKKRLSLPPVASVSVPCY
jgi:hypothetical protein